jgi:hypothetical protein
MEPNMSNQDGLTPQQPQVPPNPQSSQIFPPGPATVQQPLSQSMSTQTAQVQPPVVGGPIKTKKSSKLVIVVVVAVVVLAVMLGAVLILGKKKPVKKATGNTTQTTQTQGPQPATALSTEQINNAINQDVSGLDNEKDFPANQLDDKSLEL